MTQMSLKLKCVECSERNDHKLVILSVEEGEFFTPHKPWGKFAAICQKGTDSYDQVSLGAVFEVTMKRLPSELSINIHEVMPLKERHG